MGVPVRQSSEGAKDSGWGKEGSRLRSEPMHRDLPGSTGYGRMYELQSHQCDGALCVEVTIQGLVTVASSSFHRIEGPKVSSSQSIPTTPRKARGACTDARGLRHQPNLFGIGQPELCQRPTVHFSRCACTKANAQPTDREPYTGLKSGSANF